MFTPHSVIFVGRDTHFVRNDKNYHFLRKNNLRVKFPQFREIYLQFRETCRSRAISGDSRKFRETWQVCDTTVMLPFVDYHKLMASSRVCHHTPLIAHTYTTVASVQVIAIRWRPTVTARSAGDNAGRWPLK